MDGAPSEGKRAELMLFSKSASGCRVPLPALLGSNSCLPNDHKLSGLRQRPLSVGMAYLGPLLIAGGCNQVSGQGWVLAEAPLRKDLPLSPLVRWAGFTLCWLFYATWASLSNVAACATIAGRRGSLPARRKPQSSGA